MNSKRRAISPALADRQCLAAIDVLIIAGGLGTRIAPVLGDTPKLLAPIAGRPYLAYLLDWLRRFGAKRVVLALGHRAETIVDSLNLNNSWANDLTVAAVIEPRPLGTAGAIRFARPELRTDPVLIMNGDSFADADLCEFVRRHRAAEASATLLCAAVADAGRYGRVEIADGDRIGRFIEKDPHYRGPGLVNAGVYLFAAALLDEIAAGGAVSLERDVFERAPQGWFHAYTGPFRFIDIGTPEALAAAEQVIRAEVAGDPP